MNSLQQLFAAAQATVDAKAKAKAAARRAQIAPPADQANAIAEALRLKTEADWQPYAIVLRVDRWVCVCGCTGEAPLGFFLLQSHRTLANSYRFLPQREETSADLPRRLRIEDRPVTTCHHCAGLRGFTPLSARILPPVIGAFVRDWMTKTAPLKEHE